MGNPAVAMYHVRCPAQLLDGLEHAPGEENGPFPIVLEELAVLVAVNLFSMEVVFVVDEIHLHAGG